MYLKDGMGAGGLLVGVSRVLGPVLIPETKKKKVIYCKKGRMRELQNGQTANKKATKN